MNVKPVLGTMNFGPQVSDSESFQMVDCFLKEGYEDIDTAYVYNNGDSEKFLGNALKKISPLSSVVATKANPRVTGRLDSDSIRYQLKKSLKRLQVESVDILYLHFPDPSTPLHETLKACSDMRKDGYFNKLGLSNYSAWEVSHIWHLCKQNGWPVPCVYQGLYNGLSRNIESELIPALREFDISFYAYNPLAGGILSGKYTNFKDNLEGRFSHRPNYKERYWKKEFFDALDVLNKACQNSNLSLVEASYRWLIQHSSLSGNAGDKIIIGASSLKQFKQNMKFFEKETLTKEVLEAFELAWNISKNESPSYFRTVNQSF